jgi:NAD kinase
MIAPRLVVVSRPSDYELLLAAHGTREQARFFLSTRGQTLDEALERHELQQAALHTVAAATPRGWRQARVTRADLDRFLFEPEDVVVAVGQDGLVANVAKYLGGQTVIGVNPSRALHDGVLVRHPPEAVRDLLGPRTRVEERTMVEARARDGQTLVALNELFVGHRTHQSARYVIAFGDRRERHSSSGLICATGTGATGWAQSIARGRADAPPLPAPTAPELVFLVREAWPSVRTGTSVVAGLVAPGAAVEITSEMNEGGVVFGDGIEDDRLELPYGQTVALRRAERTLRLAA